MTWPILYNNVLKINNPKSPVGVATMWTEREVTKKLLGNADYNVIGNLYSSAGISAMIRNIYANPYIRTIILWGADLSRSGQAFISFMEQGIDDDYHIIGDEKKGQIERDIPREAIELFRKSVTVVNLRGKSPDVLKQEVAKHAKTKLGPFSEPIIFPSKNPKPFTFPSEQVGFRASAKTVAQTWLRILNVINRYGRTKKTRYAQENELKEVLNLMAVITNEPGGKEPYFPHYLPFTEKDLAVYYPQVLTAKKIPGIAYTYGQRLRANHNIDQVQEVIELIKRRPFSKKMAMFTADVAHDWGRDTVDKGDTPCLTQILCSIQDNKLIMTAHFRSQDMVHGWPRNAFSLIALQDMIAKESGYARGVFCTITHSAHMYADDYKLVDETLKTNFEKELPFTRAQHFEEDPRGNFTIEVVEQKRKRGRRSKYPFIPKSGLILLRLYSPDGGLTLKEWRGKTATEVYLQLSDWDYFGLPAHAADMGVQLTRAEYALKYGWEYSQDIGPNKM